MRITSFYWCGGYTLYILMVVVVFEVGELNLCSRQLSGTFPPSKAALRDESRTGNSSWRVAAAAVPDKRFRHLPPLSWLRRRHHRRPVRQSHLNSLIDGPLSTYMITTLFASSARLHMAHNGAQDLHLRLSAHFSSRGSGGLSRNSSIFITTIYSFYFSSCLCAENIETSKMWLYVKRPVERLAVENDVDVDRDGDVEKVIPVKTSQSVSHGNWTKSNVKYKGEIKSARLLTSRARGRN